MAEPLDSGQRPCERRTNTTRRRHGDDFYARIGRRSWAVRRLARTGDADMLPALERRRQAERERTTVWAQLLAARETVTLLREELASRLRADDQRAWRGGDGAARYRAALCAELADTGDRGLGGEGAGG